VKNARHAGLVVCALLVWALAMALGQTGCESLDTTAGQPTTTEPAVSESTESTTSLATSTTVAAPSVAVTKETSQSMCYIMDVFAQDGVNYVVVDYITVKWLYSDSMGGYVADITNNNPKLRTFTVPGDLKIWWFANNAYPIGPDSLMTRHTFQQLQNHTLEDIDSPEGRYNGQTNLGFWWIRVKDGVVAGLSEARMPDEYFTD
jgi:hypothetical protein